MTMRPAVYLAILGVLCGSACRSTSNASSTSVLDTASGTIRGRVRLMGQPPENAVIRMRADLMCDKANGGQRVVQETVVAAPDGGLANVFIQLEGEFPRRPVPAEPVTIDQRGCIYTPRVVGIRLGQPLRVQNSDPGLHNVHGVSEREGFNIGQPMAGMVNTFQLKHEGMLRLQCDVHGWMVAFVGVVSHPYFAVTGTAGTYEIHDVPVGTYMVRSWHERYGALNSSVRVEAGQVADLDLVYSGAEKPVPVSSLFLDGARVVARAAPAITSSPRRPQQGHPAATTSALEATANF